tara:strand:- start:17 stop:187 length:171 start_codon:yes stop_codon:yes gene_type:complete
MIIYNKICSIFIKVLCFSLILTLFSCSMGTETTDKGNKINNVIFSINKSTKVEIKE